jgi:predicted nucleotide-binding protein
MGEECLMHEEKRMATKFQGDLEDLQALVTGAGIDGVWKEEPGGKHAFKSTNGGVLNWWPGTGTTQFQGQPAGKAALEAAVSGEVSVAAAARPAAVAARVIADAKLPRQIFIVHGHDTDARDQLELALHRLGLEPFVLMNSSGEGKTLIEALEGKIGRDYSSDFGIVLMTPDDIGYSKKDGAERGEPRVRQNVLLETGMLLSSLTRARMAIVVKGHVELPSDLQGIIRFGYNDHVKEVVPKLCQRLKEAGFDLQPAQIASAAQ